MFTSLARFLPIYLILYCFINVLDANNVCSSLHSENLPQFYQWEVVHPGDMESGPGSLHLPVKRYNHGIAQTEHGMYINNGYFYDHARKKARYLQDLWFFSFERATWQRLSISTGPQHRFQHTISYYNNKLIVFGGDDGGFRVQAKSHVWGSYYNDLWIYDLKQETWSEVSPQPAEEGSKIMSSASLAQPLLPRTSHTTVIYQGIMFIFGGYTAAKPAVKNNKVNFLSDELVKIDLETYTYTHITPTPGPKPRARAGHTAVLVDGKMWVFGGYARETPTSRRSSLDDLWSYDIAQNLWTLHPPRAYSVPSLTTECEDITSTIPDTCITDVPVPVPLPRGTHAAVASQVTT